MNFVDEDKKKAEKIKSIKAKARLTGNCQKSNLAPTNKHNTNRSYLKKETVMNH